MPEASIRCNRSFDSPCTSKEAFLTVISFRAAHTLFYVHSVVTVIYWNSLGHLFDSHLLIRLTSNCIVSAFRMDNCDIINFNFFVYLFFRNQISITYPFGIKDLLKIGNIYWILPAKYVCDTFDLIDKIILFLVSNKEIEITLNETKIKCH